jgi:hypothetical protein
MPSNAASPEELETLLEDVCLLRDRQALSGLFEPHAVLAPIGSSREVRGRREIADVVSGVWRRGGTYLAVSPRVLQAGPTALVIAGSTVHVVRRGTQGWRYLISWLQVSTHEVS